jgi:hypothetical protein
LVRALYNYYFNTIIINLYIYPDKLQELTYN